MIVRAVLLAALLLPTVARAQDQFEIQVYDSEIAAPLETGIEMHINRGFVSSSTAPSTDPTLSTDRATHLTLEPHLGLTRYAELGGYFQLAVRSDGVLDWAGAKARVKLRLPRPTGSVVGLALNLELSSVPAQYEPNRYGSELRPVIDARLGRLYLSLNPIVGIDLAGRLAGHPQLEPAATALVRVVDELDLGLEYYAALGPVDALLPAAQQVHRVFAVGTWAHGRFGVHAGVGYGGLGDGDRWIVKAILSLAGG